MYNNLLLLQKKNAELLKQMTAEVRSVLLCLSPSIKIFYNKEVMAGITKQIGVKELVVL